jgi:bifunctional DNase/RNase
VIVTENGALVRVDLVKIVIRDTNDQQYIFLKERDGERTFPIVIGHFEASAIDRRVRGLETPRPMTHDLLAATIGALGAEIVKVVVNRLEDNTFFARLIIARETESLPIDCRPSDAIALAVQTDAPIYVAEDVIQAASSF